MAEPRSVVPIVAAVALGAIALTATLALMGQAGLPALLSPIGAATLATVGISFFLLQRYGGEFPTTGGGRAFYSLEDAAIALGLIALPSGGLALPVALGSFAAQVMERRPPVKTTFNVSAHVCAAGLVSLAFQGATALGAPVLLGVALATPLYAISIDLLLATIFARLEERPYLHVISEMARTGTLQGTAFAMALGVAAAALWLAHPLATLVLVPLFILARRHLVLTARVQRELNNHRALAQEAHMLATCRDVRTLAERLVDACARLLRAGRVEVALNVDNRKVDVARDIERGPDLGRALITAPIPDANGKPAGEVRAYMGFGVKEDFDEADKRILETLSAQAGSALSAVLAIERLENAYHLQAELTATAVAATEQPDLDTMLAALTSRVRATLHADIVAVAEEALSGDWTFRARSGEPDTGELASKLPAPRDPRVAVAPVDNAGHGRALLCAMREKPFSEHERGHLLSAAIVLATAARRRRVEDALRQAERLTALGTLVAGVAHEINNPLTYVRGNLELLELEPAQGSNDDERRQILGSALHGVTQIERITAALKEVARAPRGKKAEEDVTALVTKALAVAGARWKGNVIAHVEAQASRHAWVSGPELAQVFLNLLLNAGEAMGENGGEVYVRTRDIDDGVLVEIEDTGPGISPRDQAKLFTPFFTTKTQGTGLGLSLSRELVEAMGGELTFDSPPGRGATFRVKLPPAPQHRATPAA